MKRASVTFGEALEAMRNGARVRSELWGAGVYAKLDGGAVVTSNGVKLTHLSIIELGARWELIEPAPPMTKEAALAAIKAALDVLTGDEK